MTAFSINMFDWIDLFCYLSSCNFPLYYFLVFFNSIFGRHYIFSPSLWPSNLSLKIIISFKEQLRRSPCFPLHCRLFCFVSIGVVSLRLRCWFFFPHFEENVCFSPLISLFDCTCLKCHVWVCTESPLSHSGLSNQENISLRSPLPCHQWLGKTNLPIPPVFFFFFFLMYGYEPCPSPNLLNFSYWLPHS